MYKEKAHFAFLLQNAPPILLYLKSFQQRCQANRTKLMEEERNFCAFTQVIGRLRTTLF
jgi:hypothetical protein